MFKYDWQDMLDEIQAYTDSDFAGCREPFKFTRAGAIMIVFMRSEAIVVHSVHKDGGT